RCLRLASFTLISAAALMTPLGGCSFDRASPAKDETVSSTTQAISNGLTVPNPGSVVFLTFLTTGGGSTCSGVLITPMHVLTSAHCFKGSVNWPLATSNWGIFPEDGPVRIQNHEVPFTGITPHPNDPMSFTSEPNHRLQLFD